jgi:DNA-binding PucR family transcriptional regulator
MIAGMVGDVALVVAAEEAPVLALAADGPCGIGGLGPLTGLASSLDEALAALDLARRRGGVVRSADLATFPALLGRLGPPQLAPFLDQIARPLASYDAAHGTRLVDTLRTFLGTGGSVSTASRELFLHTNTLRHRLARIQSVTGRDPFDFDDRVAFAVALWAWDRA